MADPRLIVDPLPLRPRRFGLYSVAPLVPAEPHALMGIEWESGRNCVSNAFLASDSWCAPDELGGETGAMYPGTDESEMFQLRMVEECAGVNDFAGAKNRVVRSANDWEERFIEDKLDSIFAGLGVNVTPGTVLDLPGTLAFLEQWLDDNYAGAGIIFGSRRAVSLLSKNGSVKQHGNRLETELGNLVAGGNFGDTMADGAFLSAGQTNLWAVGGVSVRYGPATVSDPIIVKIARERTSSLVISGSPTGGTYAITTIPGGNTTTGIAYNADAAAIQAALEALADIDPGQIVVTGTYPNFTLTYPGAGPSLAADGASLTGGTTPDAVIEGVTTALPGTDNTFTVYYEKPFVAQWDCAMAGAAALLQS